MGNAKSPDNLWQMSDTSGCPEENLAVVNLQYQPKIVMAPGEWTRLRVINAGPMKHLALLVPAGCQMWILSMDGIYLEQPVYMPPSVDDINSGKRPIFMAAGNRRDIAVMCAAPGTYDLTSSDKFGDGVGGCDGKGFGD